MNNWHSFRQYWAGNHLSQYDTYGHITNNLIESNHARIKKYVDKHTSVQELLQQLVKLSSEEQSKRKLVQSKLRLKKAVVNDIYSNMKQMFEKISSFVTLVARLNFFNIFFSVNDALIFFFIPSFVSFHSNV